MKKSTDSRAGRGTKKQSVTSGGLTAEQARIVLTADDANLSDHTRRVLRKVATGKQLTAKERGVIEGIVLNAKLGQSGTTAPDADATPEEQEFTRANRLVMVMERRMRYPPMTIREIATELGVSKNTVLEDVKEMNSRFTAFSAEKAQGELAKALAGYDLIIAENRALAAHYTSPQAKAAFLNIAERAQANKAKLMGETGVIRLAAKRIEASGPNDGPIQTSNVATVFLLPAIEEVAQ